MATKKDPRDIPARQWKVRKGDIVIWYPQGKVTLKNGVVAIVEKLYETCPHQMQVCRLGGPYETWDNVWHADAAVSTDVVSDESRLRDGLWHTVEEHHAMFVSELEALSERRTEKQNEVVRQREDEQNRRLAIANVRSGKPIEEVSKEYGIDAVELATLADLGA